MGEKERLISSMLVLTLKKKNNRMKLLKGKKGKREGGEHELH